MRVAKDIDLSHRRDPIYAYLKKNFPDTARFVMASNVGMMRSEIVLYYELLYSTRAQPHRLWNPVLRAPE